MASGVDIPRVIRNGLHPSRTHSTRPDLSGLAQGGRNGIWDVMRININNARPVRTWELFVDAAASGL
jgi:hypothetical protein